MLTLRVCIEQYIMFWTNTSSIQIYIEQFWTFYIEQFWIFYIEHLWLCYIEQYILLHRAWTTGSGRLARPKNLKTPFYSRYQKFLSRGNSNGSRTMPKFFSIFFFSTNMVARGMQSFCILEGATDPLIEQWLKFFCQFIPDIWWANAENFKSISWVVLDLLPFNWKILAIVGLHAYKLACFVRMQANNCQNFSVKWQ